MVLGEVLSLSHLPQFPSFISQLLLFKQAFHTWPWLTSIKLTFRVRDWTSQKGNAFWLLPGCESPASFFNYLNLIYTHKHYKKKRYGGSKCMQAVIIYKSFSRLIGAKWRLFFPSRILSIGHSKLTEVRLWHFARKDDMGLCQTQEKRDGLMIICCLNEVVMWPGEVR